MSKKVTLGGDRLGSGNKMKVELHNYERSTHDLSYLFRSTMSAGTLVPFMKEVALPGDTFDIDLDVDISTHPTIGPLFATFKVQLDTFTVPFRLYNSLLHNNKLGIGMRMNQVLLPIFELDTPAKARTAYKDIDNGQINPSCILSYLGLRGIGISTNGQGRVKNAIPFLGYWDIYKNYYANKMESVGAVIHALANTGGEIAFIEFNGDTAVQYNPNQIINIQLNSEANYIVVSWIGSRPNYDYWMVNTEVGQISFSSLFTAPVATDTPQQDKMYFQKYIYDSINFGSYEEFNNEGSLTVEPNVVTFPLDNLDDMREEILKFNDVLVAFSVSDQNIEPYIWVAKNDALKNRLSSQEGLALKTYQSDLFNNWLNTELIDGTNGINEITAISTVGDSFTIDQLRLSSKVNQMLNRIAVSGGSYDDWQDAVYMHSRPGKVSHPVYEGGLIKELAFQEVVSTAVNENQPLGTLGGRGKLTGKHKGGKVVIKVDEPSYIMGIVSITPRIDYSQGNHWDTDLRTLDDLHKPALDEIGFQDLITEQMAWWDTEWDGAKWVQKSAGKQPAWINYMTNVNRTYGNFAEANNEMFMTLNRRYEADANGIKDLTTYIDPVKSNFIFAQTSLDAQNFWTQIAVNITARRKMSAKIMPNL